MEEIIKIDEDDSIYEDDPVAKSAYVNFGIRYLFPWQRMVISNIMESYEAIRRNDGVTALMSDAEDDVFCKGRQIVLLPTGAGKSLCFQIPTLLLDGPTLVIYPLLALMTDQQRRMEEGSLRSVTFRGGQTEAERTENFRRLKDGAKIILANPEVLQSKSLVEQLKTVGISHIAIDEAHCVSEWGDSFRPSYLGLGQVIEEINPPVITAFTATASPPVLSRVAEILFAGQAHIVRSESDRPNIHYYVRKAAVKKKEALLLAATEQRPMIIFCGTRGKCEDMARELNFCFGRGTAQFYHAGLEKEEKDAVEKWFYKSREGILCATCAYGMGVDKKDIKTVVHLEASATAEAYIQEAGRGGRDGSIAKAILLWSLQDSIDYSLFKPGTREAALRDFAEATTCRRQVLLDALGAEQAACSGCDICQGIKYDLCDWELAYKMIKRHRNFYSKDEIQEDLKECMNKRSLNITGLNIWNHNDSTETISQLVKKNMIRTDKFLWRNKLSVIHHYRRRGGIAV